MILSISLIILVISFVSLVILLWRQAVSIRNGTLLISRFAADKMLEDWQKKIDAYYYGFGLFFKTIAHYSYFYTLVIIRSVVSVFRYVLVSVEKRCIRMIDSLHGRGVVPKDEGEE